LLLTGAFAGTWVEWVKTAMREDLHSHVLLIPLISAYLFHCRRSEWPRLFSTGPWTAGGLLAAAVGLLALAWENGPGNLSGNDRLAVQVTAYLCLLGAAGCAFLGVRWLAASAFPVLFLGFMIPLPDRLVAGMEGVLMEGSAWVAYWLFRALGTPVFRDGQILQIPGMMLEVAPECSGIRSTWVLLITSLLGGYLFLRSPWRRAGLVAAVIPLGVLRNAARIVVIGLLCVSEGPEMIDSWIHRRGGPVFFVVSLVPLCALLWWLRRGERPAGPAKNRSDEPADFVHDPSAGSATSDGIPR
jgi:exosortase C (VPDSG-CTERM-specific)